MLTPEQKVEELVKEMRFQMDRVQQARVDLCDGDIEGVHMGLECILAEMEERLDRVVNPDSKPQPTEAECLSQMYADEACRMHP